MKRLTAILFWLLLGCGTVFAQQNLITVSGRVSSTDTLGVLGAYITVHNGHEYVGMTTTDGHGFFTLSLPQSENDYTLTVWCIGAEVKTFTLHPDTDKTMQVTLNLPNEIFIKGKTTYMIDGLTSTKVWPSLDADSKDHVLLDLLHDFSELSVSKEGVVSYNGNENVLILFDNQPITVEDLGQIPISNYSHMSVELATIGMLKKEYSSECCSDCMAALITFTTHPLQEEGFGGRVVAKYGFSHFANAGLDLWLSKKNFNLLFQYNADYEDDIFNGNFEYQRKTTADAVTTEYKNQCRQLRNDFRLNGFFLLNDRNSLEVNVLAKVPRLLADHAYDNSTDGERWQSLENGFTSRRWQQESVEGKVRYHHIIQPYLSHRPNSSSFSLDCSFSKAWERREDTYHEDFYDDNPIWAQSQSSEGPLSASLKADFSFKRKHGTWEAGVQALYRRNGFSQNLMAAADSMPTAFQPLQYHFTHQEVVPAVYVNYLFSKQFFSIKAGLRTEYIRTWHDASDALQSHLIFAPNVQATFRITQHQSVGLAYRCYAERPDYAELSPYRYLLDANTSLQGNPSLRPEIVNRVEAYYLLNSQYVRLSASLYYQHTANYITQIARFQENTLSIEYANIAHDAKAGLDFRLLAGIFYHCYATFNSSTYYRHASAMLDGVDWSNRGWTSDNSIEFHYSPVRRYKYYLMLHADYHIVTPQFHPQFTTSLSHYLNLEIRQFFFYKLMVSLSATDVFNTARWAAHFDNGTYSLMHRSTHKSRMVWISIAYQFGEHHPHFSGNKGENVPRSNRLISMGF